MRTISGERTIGWIAGAIFAVYPISVEPVAWISSQWDVWATVCILGAVLGFSLEWRTRNRKAYLAGLASAFLGVMMKESVLPLPLVLPFVAIATAATGDPSLTLPQFDPVNAQLPINIQWVSVDVIR